MSIIMQGILSSEIELACKIARIWGRKLQKGTEVKPVVVMNKSELALESKPVKQQVKS